MSDRRDPNDYHVRLSADGPWRVATMQLLDGVEKWLVAGGAKRIYDTDDLAEIGPRIEPPGSDPSPAAPATDAMERARIDALPTRIWSGEHEAYWRKGGAGYTKRAAFAWVLSLGEARSRTGHCGPEKQIDLEIAHDLISAVEQERQALITRDFGDGKFVINYGYFGDKAALFIEPAPVPGTVGASAGSSGLNKTECVAGGIVITFANSASAAVLRDQLEMASRLIESIRSRRG